MNGGALRAYGVTFVLGEGVELTGVATADPPVEGRVCEVELGDAERLHAEWGDDPGRRVRELSLADGTRLLSVFHDERRGYRFDAPHHGRCLVAPGGDRILCVPAERDESWQHLLVTQLAPLAATLQGMEVFHAGGVALGGRGALFCADSGTGKSTLIARLAMLGTDVLADDAVALDWERGAETVAAHPGTELVHLVPAEAEDLATAPGRPLRRVEGYRMAKTALVAPAAPTPVPVREIFLMERKSDRKSTKIEAAPGDARALLTATLMPMVSEGGRLRHHFELCAHLAETVPLYRVSVADGEPRDRLAGAVWERLAAT